MLHLVASRGGGRKSKNLGPWEIIRPKNGLPERRGGLKGRTIGGFRYQKKKLQFSQPGQKAKGNQQ